MNTEHVWFLFVIIIIILTNALYYSIYRPSLIVCTWSMAAFFLCHRAENNNNNSNYYHYYYYSWKGCAAHKRKTIPGLDLCTKQTKLLKIIRFRHRRTAAGHDLRHFSHVLYRHASPKSTNLNLGFDKN